jgi:adenylate cyclase
MRAGIHRGCPRKLGGDYLGRDVNIAARVAQAAKGDEILVSDSVAVALAGENVDLRRGKRLKAQGAPRDLRVHALR